MIIMLTGCMKTADGYVHYIEDFGPNDIECHSYYHYMRVEGGRYDSCLARYDLIMESLYTVK